MFKQQAGGQRRGFIKGPYPTLQHRWKPTQFKQSISWIGAPGVTGDTEPVVPQSDSTAICLYVGQLNNGKIKSSANHRVKTCLSHSVCFIMWSPQTQIHKREVHSIPIDIFALEWLEHISYRNTTRTTLKWTRSGEQKDEHGLHAPPDTGMLPFCGERGKVVVFC